MKKLDFKKCNNSNIQDEITILENKLYSGIINKDEITYLAELRTELNFNNVKQNLLKDFN